MHCDVGGQVVEIQQDFSMFWLLLAFIFYIYELSNLSNIKDLI